jgi:hypothetical protein
MASKLGSSPGPLAPHIERYHYENGQETNDEASSWQKANDEANEESKKLLTNVYRWCTHQPCFATAIVRNDRRTEQVSYNS